MTQTQEGVALHTVVIVVDGSAGDTRIVDLAGVLLAGKETEVTLLHVVPDHLVGEKGWDSAIVLEQYLAAETCGAVVAPLAQRLHAGFHHGHPGADDAQVQDHAREPEPEREPRLVPRHLIHRDDLAGLIAQCGVAQGREDSMALLAAMARRLEQRGIEGIHVTRDSAVGDPASVIVATAGHLHADLVVLAVHATRQPARGIDYPDGVWIAAQAPCPVLLVPVAGTAVPAE